MKTCKDILFTTHLSIPLRYAPAQRIYNIAKHLKESGFHIHISGCINLGEIVSRKLKLMAASTMMIRGESSHQEYKFHELNTSICIGTRATNPLIEFLNMILAFYQALYIFITKPCIVIASIPPSNHVLATYLASKLIGSIYVTDIRDPEEEILNRSATTTIEKVLAELFRKINYAIYRRADANIAVTSSIKEMLKKHNVNAIVIPNGADLTLLKFTEMKRSDERLILIYIGSAGRYYRLDTLLYILKLLNMKGYKVELWIVGGMDRETQIMIEKINVNSYVKYLGFYPPQKLAEIASLADIGLIPRISDPIYDYAIPVKFYEYIALGLPVFALCRKDSELSKMILRYDVGWTCEWNNIKCIATTLRNLYLNRNEIREKKKNALKLRPYIDRNKYSLMFVKIITKLLKNTSRYRS